MCCPISILKKLKAAQLDIFLHPLFVVMGSVLSGALIHEINHDGDLVWKSAIYTKIFWAIIVYLLIYAWVIKNIYYEERFIERFKDKDYCLGYMRSRNLPALADEYHKRLKKGDTSDLIEIETLLNRWL